MVSLRDINAYYGITAPAYAKIWLGSAHNHQYSSPEHCSHAKKGYIGAKHDVYMKCIHKRVDRMPTVFVRLDHNRNDCNLIDIYVYEVMALIDYN